MNKNSVIFEYGGSTSRETPEQRNFRYLEHEIKQAANIIDTHQKNHRHRNKVKNNEFNEFREWLFVSNSDK